MIDKPYCDDCLDIPTERPCESCGLGEDREVWHDPCVFGCELGTVYLQGGIPFTCPVCAGEGIGDSHAIHEYDDYVVNIVGPDV